MGGSNKGENRKIARGLGVPTFVRAQKKCDDLENSRRGSIPFLLHITVWFQTRFVDKKTVIFVQTCTHLQLPYFLVLVKEDITV